MKLHKHENLLKQDYNSMMKNGQKAHLEFLRKGKNE
jgi:hypothetical protein